MFLPAITQAEIVEQVLALASSDETAKVHVLRRTTTAALMAIAAHKGCLHEPQDHR